MLLALQSFINFKPKVSRERLIHICNSHLNFFSPIIFRSYQIAMTSSIISQSSEIIKITLISSSVEHHTSAVDLLFFTLKDLEFELSYRRCSVSLSNVYISQFARGRNPNWHGHTWTGPCMHRPQLDWIVPLQEI